MASTFFKFGDKVVADGKKGIVLSAMDSFISPGREFYEVVFEGDNGREVKHFYGEDLTRAQESRETEEKRDNDVFRPFAVVSNDGWVLPSVYTIPARSESEARNFLCEHYGYDRDSILVVYEIAPDSVKVDTDDVAHALHNGSIPKETIDLIVRLLRTYTNFAE